MDFATDPDLDPGLAGELGLNRLGMPEMLAIAERAREQRLRCGGEARTLVDEALRRMLGSLGRRKADRAISAMRETFLAEADKDVESLISKHVPALNGDQAAALRKFAYGVVTGSVSQLIDNSALPSPLQAGDQRNFQFWFWFRDIPTPPPLASSPSALSCQGWYRDSAGGGALFNLTDGLEVHVCLDGAYGEMTWACDFDADGYRLPTEAEWKCAARGAEQSRYSMYSWGDAISNSMANYMGSGDPYENDPSDNPTGPAAGSYRMARGESWFFRAPFLRLAYRYFTLPQFRSSGGRFSDPRNSPELCPRGRRVWY